MAFAPDTFNPTVVGGSVVTDSINHTLASGQSFKEGELVRLTSAGTVKVAALDTDTAGAVHGIALGNAADYAVGAQFPVALFNSGTQIMMQLADAKDANDVEVGEVSTLAVASNYWTVTDTASKGIVRITEKPTTTSWFDSNFDNADDGGAIIVSVLDSVLQGRAA